MIDLGEGLEIVLVEARDGLELDLDHVALCPADPAAAARGWEQLGFVPTGDGRLEVGGAFLELVQGDPGEPERPLLNHIGVLVDSVDEHQAEAEELGVEIEELVDAREHGRALRLGARPGQARVRRAQAVVQPDLIVAGAGMAGLVAAARARELGAAPAVLEKGDRAGGSMLLSSGVIWRHRTLDDFRAECPDGDPVLQRGSSTSSTMRSTGSSAWGSSPCSGRRATRAPSGAATSREP